jgi:tetratricopeptide (TPR) repeat protein
MQSHLRNYCYLILLLFTSFFFSKCGSPTEEGKKSKKNHANTYKNLDSSVRYVGIMACRQCHYDKYETYIETGMGKSFNKASKSKSSAKLGKHDVVYDKFSDLSYHPFWIGDTMKIMEFRLDGKDTTHKRIEKVDYIIGSGHHTNSHITEVNGYFTQMPMTYYTQKEEWDLPPGFEAGYNSRFSRKIGIECMSCHNSLPEFTKGSENKYKSVPNGISCERCHGPGEIHVKEKMAGIVVDTSKYIDYTIVNPAKLSIDLQFDVCQRCHLQGNAVLKEGKSFYDFRPGMKLSEIETIFLPKYQGAEDEFIMASHADRLKQSRCYIQTESKNQKAEENSLRPYKKGLSCVTCHNPHVSVKITGKEVFNNACKNCHLSPNHDHRDGSSLFQCSEKAEVRNKAQNNCISCHMPNSGSIDIPHVSITDHFIRKPVKKVDVASVKKFLGLFAINEKNPTKKTKAEAYLNQYEKFDHNPALLDSAKKYLETTLGYDINLQIQLYFIKKDFGKIISLCEEKELIQQDYFSINNKDPWTCYRIAEAYQNLGEVARAYKHYKKATEFAPFNLDFFNKLAGNLFSQNKPNEAKIIYQKILAENPKIAPAYCNLGYIYFTERDYRAAEIYYNKSILLDPNNEIALLNKVQLLVSKGEIKQAQYILNQLVKREPNNNKAKTMLKQISILKS